MQPCDGCSAPPDDRRWMELDGRCLCWDCVKREDAAAEDATPVLEAQDYLENGWRDDWRGRSKP